MCDQSPEAAPGARPARLPTVDTDWQGNPPVRMSTGSTARQSMVVMSPRFGVLGEDAGDGFVYLGEPDGFGIEDVLDGEVEPAVAREQRADPERAVVVVEGVVHEGSGVSVNPGPDSSWSPLPGWSPARCTPLADPHELELPVSREPCRPLPSSGRLDATRRLSPDDRSGLVSLIPRDVDTPLAGRG